MVCNCSLTNAAFPKSLQYILKITITATHKSVLVRNIIGELEFMKSNGLVHPLRPFGRAVRVDVHALWHLWVSLSRHHPAGVVELVAAVIHSHDVHQQDVLRCLIQAL